jgi:hypothetical protein
VRAIVRNFQGSTLLQRSFGGGKDIAIASPLSRPPLSVICPSNYTCLTYTFSSKINMSRSSTSAARQLTPTEELEKLEQQITLTLQGLFCVPHIEPAKTNGIVEIDHNFSRAHRIVTSSILPIIEQYADHSKAVWEGSKVSTSPI